MPRKYRIAVAGLIGSVIAFDLVTMPLRKKYAEIARIAIALDKQNNSLRQQLEYLVNMINAHDIELDEFDLIVLTNVMEA